MLILGKPLGVGVYSAALKKEALSPARCAAMVASATQLNTPGIKLGARDDVHALTDVTGFGLLGHLLEICRGSNVAATLHWDAIPLFDGVEALVREGYVTGASGRNWTGYSEAVTLDNDLPAFAGTILTDPQTSGGLLVACAPESVDAVLRIFRDEGFAQARVIGECRAGSPHVGVRLRP